MTIYEIDSEASVWTELSSLKELNCLKVLNILYILSMKISKYINLYC